LQEDKTNSQIKKSPLTCCVEKSASHINTQVIEWGDLSRILAI